MLVLGSSMSGINNITQAVPSCDAEAIISSSQGCNATSLALSLMNPISRRSSTKTGTFTIPDKTFHKNLFNDSFSCPQSGAVPAFNGGISVDLNSTVGGSINYAITFAGILHALDGSALSLVVGFDASLDGTLSLTADLVVSTHYRDPARTLIIFIASSGHPFHGGHYTVHDWSAWLGLREDLQDRPDVQHQR